MVNITIYPYGNANERLVGTEYEFTCQHGADECDGNMVETCFINLVNFDQNEYMDFFIAYETELKRNSRDPYGTAQTMLGAGNYTVTWDALSACIGSSGAKGGATGNVFEHQMALWTDEANHQYTPWITLEGKHTDTIQNDCSASTLECTCAVYQGTNSCCSKLEKKRSEERCYKD